MPLEPVSKFRKVGDLAVHIAFEMRMCGHVNNLEVTITFFFFLWKELCIVTVRPCYEAAWLEFFVLVFFPCVCIVLVTVGMNGSPNVEIAALCKIICLS